MDGDGARKRAGAALARALRIAVAAGSSLAVVGLVDRYGSWPLLTATLGPTAYLFAAHPATRSARRRNATIGHAVAIASGLAALALFGLWNEPSQTAIGHVRVVQAFATAAALAGTLFVLELLDRHHAPAAATVVLITTGLARPGRPLLGLVCGLALLIALSPLLAWSPSPNGGPGTAPLAPTFQ